MPQAVIGLDVGGANLKAAHSSGPAFTQPFELWRNPAGLAEAVAELIRRLPPANLLAVTMTGELCDCFPTRRQGVHAILGAVEEVADSVPVRVWTSDGQFVDCHTARLQPLRTAAANWLALATYAARWLSSGSGLVMDIGSTTTDIIPVAGSKPVPRGRTDSERLKSRELVYTGWRRTPLCALLGGDGAAELFAQTLDVYLALGMVPENPADLRTADGRPATKAAAHSRLARMICGDAESCSEEETTALARMLADRQIRLIREAVRDVCKRAALGPVPDIVIAGSGEPLARLVLESRPKIPSERIVSLAARLGPMASEAACAVALSRLAQEASGELPRVSGRRRGKPPV
jgi:probable H4MPT-linked C1 transfer pathway protein